MALAWGTSNISNSDKTSSGCVQLCGQHGDGPVTRGGSCDFIGLVVVRGVTGDGRIDKHEPKSHEVISKHFYFKSLFTLPQKDMGQYSNHKKEIQTQESNVSRTDTKNWELYMGFPNRTCSSY